MGLNNFSFKSNPEFDMSWKEFKTRGRGIVAIKILYNMKKGAPVKTGDLRDSLDFELQEENLIEFHDGVYYGIYNEYANKTKRGFFRFAPRRAFNDILKGLHLLWIDIVGVQNIDMKR